MLEIFRHFVSNTGLGGLRKKFINILNRFNQKLKLRKSKNRSSEFRGYRELFIGQNFSTPGMDDIPKIGRALVIGTCLTEALTNALPVPYDFMLFWQGDLPSPPKPIDQYDFQIIQIPLRLVIEDSDLMKLSYESSNEWQIAFANSKLRLKKYFDIYSKYMKSHNKPTFFLNYISPCVNTMGRLHSKYDYRNISFFINELNKHLQELALEHSDAYIIDIDNLASMYGKRYYSEEFLFWYTHGGIGWPSPDNGLDGSRLEKTPPIEELFEVADIKIFLGAIANEILASWTTIKGHSAIKLIVVDLDDTLWNGVVGEMIRDDLPGSGGLMNAVWGDIAEGWPLGLVEALQICRMRGIILAIISKNSESTIVDTFPKIFGEKISLNDFAVKRINWGEKVKNMEEILSIVNVLPENVIYIDDSPIERNLMSSKFPSMRIIGKYFQYTRHMLISGPYTQVKNINTESSLRSESIKFREATLSRGGENSEKDVSALSVKINVHHLPPSSPQVITKRVLELTQKTNQWKLNDTLEPDLNALNQFRGDKGNVICFEVIADKLNFGIVAVAFYRGQEIEQFVMSCRVAGLSLEKKFLDTIAHEVNSKILKLKLKKTVKNLPIREWIESNCEIQDGIVIYKSN